MKQMVFAGGMSLILLLSGCNSSTPTKPIDTNDTNDTNGTVVTIDTTDPVFTSAAESTVAENQTEAITLRAIDNEGSVTITIAEGDASIFDTVLVNAALKVTFKTAPDFETRDTYGFTATATDAAGNTATQSVTIHITNDICTNGDVITHKGINYCPVTSPYGSKKVWLDRNLGALQVCQDYNDTQCYGGYYQWGRDHDGHQDSNSSTTIALALHVDAAGEEFIESNATFSDDWVNGTVDDDGSMRITNWSKVDGTNVCPVGYRVPTIDELKAELLDQGSAQIDRNSSKPGNNDDRRVNAFKCFMKIPSPGYRLDSTATIFREGQRVHLWSTHQMGDTSPYYVYVTDLVAGSGTTSRRADGAAVRCIKE